MSTYTVQFHDHFNPPPAPVSEPLPGREADMVVNNAGAYTFSLGHSDRLLRFLILGADGATYYATKDAHFKQAYTNVEAAIKALGPAAVEVIAEVSEKGRAPKQDAAIFALALAAARGDTATRSAAIAAIPRVCRIPTHLFSFLTDYKALGGKTGGRAMKTALQRWYLDKPAASVAYAMVKYRQRGGWTHRDVLRLCKPSNVPTPHHHVFAWATGNPVDYNRYDYMKIIAAYCHAQFPLLSDEAIATIIRDHNLPREAVPDDRLKSAVVWRALLHAGGGMPMTALIRCGRVQRLRRCCDGLPSPHRRGGVAVGAHPPHRHSVGAPHLREGQRGAGVAHVDDAPAHRGRLGERLRPLLRHGGDDGQAVLRRPRRLRFHDDGRGRGGARSHAA